MFETVVRLLSAPLLLLALPLTVAGCGSDSESTSGTGGGNDGPGAGGAAGGPGAVSGWDWNGIIGTGQSLAVGTTPVTSDTQPYGNLKLSLGSSTVPPFDPDSGELSMVPLVEPIRPPGSGFPRPYPDNIWGETPHSAMANQITALVQAEPGGDYVSVHSVVGESGQGMSEIEKGAVDTGTTGRAYAASLFEVESISRLAAESEHTYGVGAVVLTHGETDAGNGTYDDQIVQMWSDYNADISALTGQTRSIPLLVSQQHSYPTTAGTRSVATQIQWELGLQHPGDVVCTGPKYQYEGDDDGIHLTSRGYRQLGEKLGQIYYQLVVLGQQWQPLQPVGVARDGTRTIVVTFHVPVPPLIWNDDLPSPHQEYLSEWALGRGFEVRARATEYTITSVEIVGDTVEITCDSDLPESDLMVGYAVTSDGTPMAGGSHRWGHLRDSDPLVGLSTGDPLPNYAVAFEMPVP
jgi:hypothetical protein